MMWPKTQSRVFPSFLHYVPLYTHTHKHDPKKHAWLHIFASVALILAAIWFSLPFSPMTSTRLTCKAMKCVKSIITFMCISLSSLSHHKRLNLHFDEEPSLRELHYTTNIPSTCVYVYVYVYVCGSVSLPLSKFSQHDTFFSSSSVLSCPKEHKT